MMLFGIILGFCLGLEVVRNGYFLDKRLNMKRFWIKDINMNMRS